MPTSLTFWIVAAVLVFWAVGAYNRLVRLRGDANAAFALVEAELQRQVQLVQSHLPDGEGDPVSRFEETSPSFWAGLQGAAAQLSASLAVARQRPLEPDRIAALAAAQGVLETAWERAERDDAHDLAGPRLPQDITISRTQLVLQAASAADQFDAAVRRYNDAIAQFPAVLLAWLFGFQRARVMRVER